MKRLRFLSEGELSNWNAFGLIRLRCALMRLQDLMRRTRHLLLREQVNYLNQMPLADWPTHSRNFHFRNLPPPKIGV